MAQDDPLISSITIVVRAFLYSLHPQSIPLNRKYAFVSLIYQIDFLIFLHLRTACFLLIANVQLHQSSGVTDETMKNTVY